MTPTPEPSGVVRFTRCGTLCEAEVIGRDPHCPPQSRDPRYLARSTYNRMVVAFTLSELRS